MGPACRGAAVASSSGGRHCDCTRGSSGGPARYRARGSRRPPTRLGCAPTSVREGDPSMAGYDNITFLSDYGLEDHFVGVCHGVIARIAPNARVIDLAHGIPPQDVLRGAMVLAGAAPFMPEDAVYLGVVDPDVGGPRGAVAVRAASGALLVGPDNGLLSLAWEALGGAEAAVEIAAPDVLLEPVSATFHGRDVFAPAA